MKMASNLLTSYTPASDQARRLGGEINTAGLYGVSSLDDQVNIRKRSTEIANSSYDDLPNVYEENRDCR